MDDSTLKIFAFIKISSYRTKAVKALREGNKTPTEISKYADVRLSHISNVLRELKERNVAECINEEKRKNRIYRLTDLGQEIADYLE